MAEISTELRETERRVLGNLPAYRTDDGHEAAIKAAVKAGTIASPEEWPTSRTLEDLTDRVAADRHSRIDADGKDVVLDILEDLQGHGLVTRDGEQWAMTEAGLDALTA